ncbi:glyoxalase [Indibacter alkaliphilus LW1]|uniref:Glyoxalase n=1 Tax=Indibacter alkaliphilus (strain CCUG 57479 / KCTC 22604 / LW1) TaxID=1189612 RepID=S2CYD8_INDAL|nr:hypothetical protein [Indibacter alkaliphilus]EOZ91579.1 glyoxalase [Indibacter alkaliphilus LW1]
MGLETDQWGTNFEWRQGSDPLKKGFTQWSSSAEESTHFVQSEKDFIINHSVENLEALQKKLKKYHLESGIEE